MHSLTAFVFCLLTAATTQSAEEIDRPSGSTIVSPDAKLDSEISAAVGAHQQLGGTDFTIQRVGRDGRLG